MISITNFSRKASLCQDDFLTEKRVDLNHGRNKVENALFYNDDEDKAGNNEIVDNNNIYREKLNAISTVKSRFFCVICEKLLQSPIQTTCGCRACENCFLDYLKSGFKHCPTNSKDCADFESKIKLKDRAIVKEMSKIIISCINDDCEVSLTLMRLYSHLRNCPSSFVDCTKCYMKFQLKNKIEHETTVCPNRNVSCEFCSMEMTLYEYQNIHYNLKNTENLCENFPSKCPNECSSDTYPNIKSHLNLMCERNSQNSELVKRQNEAKIPENDLLVEILSQVNTLEKKRDFVKKQSSEVNNLYENIQNLKDKLNSIKHDLASNSLELIRFSIVSKFVWKVEKFNNLLNDSKTGNRLFCLSEPFYTNEIGYKLLLKIYPNGDGSAIGSHFSIFIAIAKGKFDSLLTWPFLQKFTIKILNQNGGKHHTELFKTDSDSLCYKRPVSEINTAFGNPNFISHKILFETNNYIKNETMFIKFELEK